MTTMVSAERAPSCWAYGGNGVALRPGGRTHMRPNTHLQHARRAVSQGPRITQHVIRVVQQADDKRVGWRCQQARLRARQVQRAVELEIDECNSHSNSVVLIGTGRWPASPPSEQTHLKDSRRVP